MSSEKIVYEQSMINYTALGTLVPGASFTNMV